MIKHIYIVYEIPPPGYAHYKFVDSCWSTLTLARFRGNEIEKDSEGSRSYYIDRYEINNSNFYHEAKTYDKD